MRRTIRIDRSIDLLRPRAATTLPSPFLCAVCYRQGLSFSTTSFRAADPKTPFTKRIQQKIWGTDQPPGLDDPYGGSSVFEQSKKRAQEKEVRHQEALAPRDPDARSPIPALSSSYEPATTWDGLQKVGGFGDWWRKHWDPEHQFEGFPPRERVTDAEVIVAALHRAIVEVFALQKVGKPLSAIPKVISRWDPTDDVQIIPSSSGATLNFPMKTSLDEIIQTLTPSINETSQKEAPTESEEGVAADRSTVDSLHPESKHSPSVIVETIGKGQPTESEEDVAADRSDPDPLMSNSISHRTYAEVIASWDPAWLEISLENPEIKFAVLKRAMQLTGIRIPDPVIQSANTAQALLRHLIAPSKPRKLTEALAQNEDLLGLPNIRVYERRITPVDKEMSIGRWKLIEQELQVRGLPVFGHYERRQMGEVETIRHTESC